MLSEVEREDAILLGGARALIEWLLEAETRASKSVALDQAHQWMERYDRNCDRQKQRLEEAKNDTL